MGLVSRLISFVRVSRNSAQITDVKLNPGGGTNITAEHFAGVGDDSHPLGTDYAVSVATPQAGRHAVVGYVDPKNTPKAKKGEKRIYSRDSSGEVIVELWLKDDGEAILVNENGSVTLSANGGILGQNSNGSFNLQQGGDFIVNGVTIDKDGKVTIPTSLTLAGKEIAGHNHPITGGSSAPGPTGPNN